LFWYFSPIENSTKDVRYYNKVGYFKDNKKLEKKEYCQAKNYLIFFQTREDALKISQDFWSKSLQMFKERKRLTEI